MSTTNIRYPPRNNCLGVRDYVYSITEKIDRTKKQNLHNFDTPALAPHNTHHTLQAPEPHPPARRRMCHLRSADSLPQVLIKLQFRERLCIRTRCTQASSTCGLRNNSSGRPCASISYSRYWRKCTCAAGPRQNGAQIQRCRCGMLAP